MAGVEGVAGAIDGEGDEVVKAELVLVEEVRQEVAGADGIAAPIEERAGRIGHAGVAAGRGGADEIGERQVVRLRAGDVPAAEAQRERDGVADLLAAEAVEARARGGADDGFGEQAGHLLAGARGVAVHAALTARDLGAAIRGGAEDAKNGAEFRVDGGDLEAPAGDVAEINLIVEIQGARVRRLDEPALKTGRRINEKLLGRRDAEGFEEAGELGLVAGGVELDFAAGDLRDDP